MVGRAMVKSTTSRKPPRKPDGVIAQSAAHERADPYGKLPAWARPLHGERLEEYRDRLGMKIGLDSLIVSFRGDTAAHAKWREAAMKSLGLGNKVELDITARQDDVWLARLTDQELEQLAELKQVALARTTTGSGDQLPAIPQNTTQDSNTSDNNTLQDRAPNEYGSDKSNYVKSVDANHGESEAHGAEDG